MKVFVAVITGFFVSLIPMSAESPAADAGSPVGHWVAEHSSQGGIGSWWDFRADGTLTLYFGAMVTSSVKQTGDVLLMPPATIGGAPGRVGFRIDGNQLHLIDPGNQELLYTRIGKAPDPSNALLGKWRPVGPATLSSDPQMAALEKAKQNAMYVFAADGTESVRIPFGAREGTWDLAARTFKFPNETVVYSFSFAGSKLVLGQPPDGKATDSYLSDPLF